jgi:hypothetical protein
MTDPRDVRMMNLRRGPRFAQKARLRTRILCDFSVDYFQRHCGIQNRIARTISYRHCSGSELNGKTVRANFDFEVVVFQ